MENPTEVIYPEIEPGVIGKEMIENAFLETGYKGESLRLHQLESVCYEKITILRLEFLNILCLDHLWLMPNLTILCLNGNKIEVIENIEMLTSLRDLNLSFNCIRKIENLDTFRKLESLNLSNNMITSIEGLDELENLTIFSLRNNMIDSIKGLERIRFLSKLCSLALSGNPISVTLPYIAAFLPNLKYYEYVYLDDEIKMEARETFAQELRRIETGEEQEIERRNYQAQKLAAEETLSSSFVEHLNEHQLYESLWEHNEASRSLLQVSGNALDELLVEYRNEIYTITKKIYILGLKAFEERQQEIQIYTNSVDEGVLATQNSGLRAIDELQLAHEQIFKEATVCLKQLESRTIQGEDDDSPENIALMEKLEKISLNFYEKSSTVSQTLVGEELYLNEGVLETMSSFERNIGEMMSKFVEKSKSYFTLIRDIAVRFSEDLLDLVHQYLEMKMSMRDFVAIPAGLKMCLEDKDALLDLITGMKDHHIQRIDEREDRLANRSRQFIEELIEEMQKNELERNRKKIIEINDYIVYKTNQFESLQHDVREQLLNENI